MLKTEDWYNSLSKEEKKKVHKTGMQDNTEYFNERGIWKNKTFPFIFVDTIRPL